MSTDLLQARHDQNLSHASNEKGKKKEAVLERQAAMEFPFPLPSVAALAFRYLHANTYITAIYTPRRPGSRPPSKLRPRAVRVRLIVAPSTLRPGMTRRQTRTNEINRGNGRRKAKGKHSILVPLWLQFCGSGNEYVGNCSRSSASSLPLSLPTLEFPLRCLPLDVFLSHVR
jgi:hypothetical protein